MKKIFGYTFKNPELLKEACTHPSVKHMRRYVRDYERMEFLGDAILNAVIANLLYCQYPDCTDGQLSMLQAALINKDTLSQLALQHNLGAMIIMDKGEEKIGGRTNINNLENVLEAIIAAIFLDSSYEIVLEIIKEIWQDRICTVRDVRQNPVSRLQELMQGQGRQIPQYVVQEVKGMAHEPIFTIAVVLDDEQEFVASGSSKKEAKIAAAAKALQFFEEK